MKNLKMTWQTMGFLLVALLSSTVYGNWDVYPGDVDDGGWSTWANQSHSVTQSGSDYIFSAWARVDTYIPCNYVYSTRRIDNAYNWVQITQGTAYAMFMLATISNISDADNRNAETFVQEGDLHGAYAIVHAERNPYN